MTLPTSGIISLSQIATELGVPASSTLAYMVSVANSSINKVAPHKLSEWYGYSGTPINLTSISLTQAAFSSSNQSFTATLKTNKSPYGRIVKIHLHVNPTGYNSGNTLYDGIVYSGVAPQTSTSWSTGKIELNLDYLWSTGKIDYNSYNIMCYYTAYFEDNPSNKVEVSKQFIRTPPISTTSSS